MSMDYIKTIREAEGQAEEIRKQALQRSRDLVRQAQEETDDLGQKTVSQIHELMRDGLAQAESETQAEIEGLMVKNAEECEGIKGRAQDNLDRAVAFIMGRIVKSHGNH